MPRYVKIKCRKSLTPVSCAESKEWVNTHKGKPVISSRKGEGSSSSSSSSSGMTLKAISITKSPGVSPESTIQEFCWVIGPIKNDYKSVLVSIKITLICHIVFNMVALLICNKHDIRCRRYFERLYFFCRY